MAEFNNANNPLQQSAHKNKYIVNVTFQLKDGELQKVDLAFTSDSSLTGDKNIVLVFEGEYYNGHIDCPNIDSVKGTFVVNGKTYTLEKKDDILEASSPVLNYVQINCDGLVHSFELVDVNKAASSVLTNIFSKVNKGGKSYRKASRKASRKSGRKLGRKSVGNKKRNRGTRKK